jgi:predicted phosphodiesterase
LLIGFKIQLINKFKFSLILLLVIIIPFFSSSPYRISVTAITFPDLPKHIHLTFQNDPSSTITVTWQTNTSTTGDMVLYDSISHSGDPSLYQHQAIGSHHTYEGASGYIHDVELTGLRPDSTYFFICGGLGNYSEERSFKTAPNLASNFTFVIGGDSRHNTEDRTTVSQAMSLTNPSFVVHSGDMVDAGEFQSYWDVWFTDVKDNWIGDNGLTIPIIPCLGNHEHNATNYYEQFALPKNEQWYYYDWGPSLRIIVLNSESFPSQIALDQVNWLEEVLDATPWYMWKLVLFHRNVYYSGGHDNATDIIRSWVPIFDKYHVDIVFQGHTHLYHRTKPMKNDTVVSSYDEGRMYVTSAGWGAPPYAYFEQAYSAYGNSSLHYTLLSVYSNGTLHLEAKDVNGLTFDETKLTKDVRNYNGISISTTSTIPGFTFDQSTKKITFTVSDSPTSTGFCNVTVPKPLLGGSYTVYLDGTLHTAISTENATHASIYTTYTFPPSQDPSVGQSIDIVGSIVYSALSYAVSSDSLTTDDSTTIFGTITPAIATEVILQIKTNGEAAWNILTTVPTTSAGTYSYQWHPSSTGTFNLRAVWAGDSNYFGTTSSVKTLTVKNPTTLSCQLSQTSLPLTDNIVISGTITPPRSGASITLYYRNNAVWNFLKTVTSTADGTYSHTWTPPLIGSYQLKASWTGDSSFGGATSSEVTLIVSKTPTTLSCSVASPDVTEGEFVTISGAISPAVSNVTVTLTYLMPGESTVTRTVTTEADGSYSDSYQPKGEGTWSVTTTWDGDLTHEGASSSSQSFTIKQRGCLIATATYGSELSPQVQFLREFRDNSVLSTFAGSNFMTIFNKFYYSFSPNVASGISDNLLLRDAMKHILYPLIGILHVSSVVFSIFYALPELGVVITGFLSSSLIGFVYVLPFMLLLFFIKKFQISPKIIRFLNSIWIVTCILLVIADITKSSLLMMPTTGIFVLVTLFLTTLTAFRQVTKHFS